MFTFVFVFFFVAVVIVGLIVTIEGISTKRHNERVLHGDAKQLRYMATKSANRQRGRQDIFSGDASAMHHASRLAHLHRGYDHSGDRWLAYAQLVETALSNGVFEQWADQAERLATIDANIYRAESRYKA